MRLLLTIGLGSACGWLVVGTARRTGIDPALLMIAALPAVLLFYRWFRRYLPPD